MRSVIDKWGSKIAMLCDVMESLSDNGFDVSHFAGLIKLKIDQPYKTQMPLKEIYLSSSPLEMLYLKLIQYEYLGQMKDMLEIYGVQADLNYDIPDEYVKEMEKFEFRKLDADDFDAYFEDGNIKKIAKYVYLKPEPSTKEQRKIRNSKQKVLNLLNFTSLTEPGANVMEDIDELQIISCLQAIILDKPKKFNYTFPNYEGTKGNRKGKKSVNKALTDKDRPYDAFQAYWLIRVKDHIYLNLGKSELRKTTKEVEKMCVDISEKILNCPTIGEMQSMHKFYNEWLTMLCDLGKINLDLSTNPFFN